MPKPQPKGRPKGNSSPAAGKTDGSRWGMNQKEMENGMRSGRDAPNRVNPADLPYPSGLNRPGAKSGGLSKNRPPKGRKKK